MLGVEDTAFLPLGGVPSTLSHCALPAEHRGGSSSALLVASASTLSVVGSDAAGEPVHATALRVPLLGAASPDSARGGAGDEASPAGVDIVSVACVPSDQPSVQPFAVAVAALRSGGPAECIDAADTKAPTDAVLFVFGEASPSHASLQMRMEDGREIALGAGCSPLAMCTVQSCRLPCAHDGTTASATSRPYHAGPEQKSAVVNRLLVASSKPDQPLWSLVRSSGVADEGSLGIRAARMLSTDGRKKGKGAINTPTADENRKDSAGSESGKCGEDQATEQSGLLVLETSCDAARALPEIAVCAASAGGGIMAISVLHQRLPGELGGFGAGLVRHMAFGMTDGSILYTVVGHGVEKRQGETQLLAAHQIRLDGPICQVLLVPCRPPPPPALCKLSQWRLVQPVGTADDNAASRVDLVCCAALGYALVYRSVNLVGLHQPLILERVAGHDAILSAALVHLDCRHRLVLGTFAGKLLVLDMPAHEQPEESPATDQAGAQADARQLLPHTASMPRPRPAIDLDVADRRLAEASSMTWEFSPPPSDRDQASLAGMHPAHKRDRRAHSYGMDQSEGWLRRADAADACRGTKPTTAPRQAAQWRHPTRPGLNDCGSACLVAAGGPVYGIYSQDLTGNGLLDLALVLHDGIRLLQVEPAAAAQRLQDGLEQLLELQRLERAVLSRRSRVSASCP